MSKTDDAWRDVGSHFTRLGEKFNEHYGSQEETQELGPDVKEAFRGLAKAAERVATTISEAVRDEEVKAEAKAAANSFVGALGATFDEVGEELGRALKKPAPADNEDLSDAEREIAEAAGDVMPEEAAEDEPEAEGG